MREWSGGDVWEISVLSTQFCFETEIALKKLSPLKKKNHSKQRISWHKGILFFQARS